MNDFKEEFNRKLIFPGRRPESGKSGFGGQGSKINDFPQLGVPKARLRGSNWVPNSNRWLGAGLKVPRFPKEPALHSFLRKTSTGGFQAWFPKEPRSLVPPASSAWFPEHLHCALHCSAFQCIGVHLH